MLRWRWWWLTYNDGDIDDGILLHQQHQRYQQQLSSVTSATTSTATASSATFSTASPATSSATASFAASSASSAASTAAASSAVTAASSVTSLTLWLNYQLSWEWLCNLINLYENVWWNMRTQNIEWRVFNIEWWRYKISEPLNPEGEWPETMWTAKPRRVSGR